MNLLLVNVKGVFVAIVNGFGDLFIILNCLSVTYIRKSLVDLVELGFTILYTDTLKVYKMFI